MSVAADVLLRRVPLTSLRQITPTKFQASINEINEVLISAYSLKWSALENVLGVMTLYASTFLIETHHKKVIVVAHHNLHVD